MEKINVGCSVLIRVEVNDGIPVIVRVGVLVGEDVAVGIFKVDVRLGPSVGTV